MDMDRALEALAALGQRSRLEIFRLLVREGGAGMAAGDIAAAMESRQNTTSTNLAILARAGLIAGERDGRSIRYRADLGAARDLIGFLLEDCCNGAPEVCAPILSELECLRVGASSGCPGPSNPKSPCPS
jgi:ArsR family transcriptional regulator, arsenate/arsenite/antimonite-responsive transcriptional repressor